MTTRDAIIAQSAPPDAVILATPGDLRAVVARLANGAPIPHDLARRVGVIRITPARTPEETVAP